MKTYKEFWPYYLSQHQSPICRWLHFAGTTFALIIACMSILYSEAWFLLLAIGVGYCFSWIGHFVFEKNVPATFQFPLWSLRAEFQMYVWMCMRKLN